MNNFILWVILSTLIFTVGQLVETNKHLSEIEKILKYENRK